jgi:two-component system cell cycle sensor histidine kinase/response regulator CckA
MASAQVRVLLIDDDEDDFVMIRSLLSEADSGKFKLTWISNFAKGQSEILSSNYDVALVDYRLGEHNGIELLPLATSLQIPVIVLTGYGDKEIDLKAMRHGAADYLVKGQVTANLLERSIRYAVTRAEALRSLREREESFRSLLNSVFEGILVHDRQGLVLDANEVAASLLSLSLGSLLGANLASSVPREVREAIVFLTTDLQAGKTKELLLESADSNVYLEIASKEYLYRGQNVFLTAIRDISSRKQMEAQILQQDRLASIGLLASSLAHEIGTPLGVVRGRSELLAHSLMGQPEQTKNIGIIISQIDRITKLIRSLLTLARGPRAGATERVHLLAVVNDVTELMSQEFAKNHIHLEIQVSPEHQVNISSEAESLHQVVLNLIVNAVHAIEKAISLGRKSGHRLRIFSQVEGSQIILGIEDSGTGISADHAKHIFKPFFTTKEIGVGTGLGLATSYRIIETWGGHLEFNTVPGQGSVFRVRLPYSAST